MADMMTAAVTASQSRIYEQISMSVMKMNAQAEQALADMLTKNAEQAAELARQTAASSRGGIDIYA